MIQLPRTPLADPKSGRVQDDWLVGVFNKLAHQVFAQFSTAGGNLVKALPDASKNLNTEYIFIKSTGDANTLTISGANGGNVVLTTQWQRARFWSDGGQWYPV